MININEGNGINGQLDQVMEDLEDKGANAASATSPEVRARKKVQVLRLGTRRRTKAGTECF